MGPVFSGFCYFDFFELVFLERCGKRKGKEYNVKTCNIFLFFSIISLIVRICCGTMDSCQLPCRGLRFTGLKQRKRKEGSGSWDLSHFWSQPVTEPALSIFQSHPLLSSGQNVHCLCQCLSPGADAQCVCSAVTLWVLCWQFSEAVPHAAS